MVDLTAMYVHSYRGAGRAVDVYLDVRCVHELLPYPPLTFMVQMQTLALSGRVYDGVCSAYRCL